MRSAPKTFRSFWCSLALAAGALATVLASTAGAAPLRSAVYVAGLVRPVAFVQDPGDPRRQFVVEQGGRIRVIQHGALLPTPFLDLSDSVGEQGLLGLAFPADYATSGRFFVYLTRAEDGLVVARFRRSSGDPLVADPTSRFDLRWSTGLRYIERPTDGHAHGGHLAFGPDGYLYIGTADGGGGSDPRGQAQDASSLLGKMLRIDVHVPESDPEGFDVPDDNPFLDGLPIPAHPEVWAVGLRHPWRWSFDDPDRGGTGALVIADVGPTGLGEIDYEPANRGGRNYGWSARDGATDNLSGAAAAYGPLRDPILEVDGRFSTFLVGGVVYRGSLLGAAYTGRYFFADFPSQRVYSVALRTDGDGEASASDFREHTADLGDVGPIIAFGVDAQGELYLVSWASGEILRLLPDGDAPVAATLVSPSGTIGISTPTYAWNAVSDSEWYYLWVTDRGGVRIQQWLTAAAAGCAGGTGVCSATPAMPVAGGPVTWWIQTWNGDGFGPWSEPLSFVASVPAQVTTITPSGSIPTSRPTYTWNASSLATHYYLWVTDRTGVPAVQTWYPAADVGCAAGTGTCSVTPAVRLPSGQAWWWIQPWNTVGYGGWSVVRPFTIDPPAIATLISPTGTITTATPAYTWNAVPTATDYYLWVNDTSGSGRIKIWYTAAAAGCPDGTGTCSVTPTTTVTVGAATWWIQTWNEAGFGPWSVGLDFTVSLGPAFTSAAATTFSVGVAGTFTVTTVGTPTPAVSSTGALPTGVTFVDNGNGTATLSGTPAAGTGGIYPLTFTAANGVLPNGTQAFTLNVNQAPVITSATSTTFAIGTPGSFTVTTSGFPTPTLAIGGAALPAGVSFVDNGNGTGTLSGTPAAGSGGTYAITFTAANAAGTSAPQAFTLTVNQAPTITSANTATFTVGTPGTFTVTTTASPVATITRTGAALPAGVTFVDNGDGTGTLSGTPGAGTAGAYAITFTASNGVAPDAVQAFTLNVQEAPAITSASSTTFTVGTPGTFTVTTTGFPAPTVSQSGALPTGITFTPATRVLGGTATQTGAFPLVFTATNGVSPDATQNFTLNVVCPTITVTPLVMPEGLFQTVYPGVDFNQTGSTGSTFTWGATGLPAGLSIDATTGVVSGTPTDTVLNGAVVVTVTDNFGCVGTLNTTITVRPTTDNESYTGGVGHTQYVVGAAVPSTPHVFVNDNVKTGDNGPGPLTVTFPATSVNGSIVEGTTDGTFIYTPNLNFAGPSDSFTYTLTDGNGVTNTGTVTIALSGLVWYVNSSGGNGDGRSHNPFNTLTAAGTASSAGSIIYVHTGGATTTGNLTMDANQSLFGQGAPFVLNSLTIGAGARPTLTGTVTLANNTIVTAVNFLGAAPALTASGVTGPATIDQVGVSGGTSALSLTNVSGAVTVTNSSFTNTSAAEVLINQGTGAVSIAATISSNAGRSVDIQNRTGGTVTFSGSITDTAQGVFLNANTGSTINFTGGLALTTGTNPGFTATGGGTVSATQNNTTIVNTITTTTGIALNVANTTIGASGLTFRSISANGAASGIVLSSTGTIAGLTVTGTGAAVLGGNGTGGTIQNTGGHGVSLNSTRSPSFANVTIQNTGGSGISGTFVTNFSFVNGTISESGDALGESNLAFNGGGTMLGDSLSGTLTVTNSILTNAFDCGLHVAGDIGTITNATITGNLITSTTDVLTSKGDGIRLVGTGTSSTVSSLTRATISGNTIRNFPSAGGIQVNYGNANASGPGGHAGIAGDLVNIISITNNVSRGNSAGLRFGTHAIIFAVSGGNSGSRSQGNFDVSNNGTVAEPIGNSIGIAVGVGNNGYSTMTATISNNVIVANNSFASGGISGGNGVVLGNETPDLTLTVAGNNISQTDGNGILLVGRGNGNVTLGTQGIARLRIQNNTVAAPLTGVRPGIRVDAGNNAANTDDAVCVNMSGNTTGGSGGHEGIGLRKQGTVSSTHDFGVHGMSATSTPGVEEYVGNIGQNPGSANGSFGLHGVLLISASSGFSSCSFP